jgi:hypothetical protein
MQRQNSEDRLEKVQAFLRANGASVFGNSLYSLPELHQAMNSGVTVILAPSNKALGKLATSLTQSVEKFIATLNGQEILANHISVLPIFSTFPLLRSINGFKFGNSPTDVNAMGITTSTNIDGIPIMIIDTALTSPTQTNPSNLTRTDISAVKIMIQTGNMKGADLINLCDSDPAINNNLCMNTDASGKTIFHQLLLKEYGIDYLPSEDAKTRYRNKSLGITRFKNYIKESKQPIYAYRLANDGSLVEINGTEYDKEAYIFTNGDEKPFYLNRFDKMGRSINYDGGLISERKLGLMRNDNIIRLIYEHPVDIHVLIAIF